MKRKFVKIRPPPSKKIAAYARLVSFHCIEKPTPRLSGLDSPLPLTRQGALCKLSTAKAQEAQ
jgi:hypothetical protein